MAQHFIVTAILKSVRALPRFPRLRVLDLSCGRGSRWKFFWTGTHKLIRERPSREVAPAELYAYHINPLDLPLAHTLLHQAGLRVTRLRFTRFKPEHAWLLLFYPLIWMATRIEIRDRDLFRLMTHPATLVSEQLLLVAERNVLPLETSF